MIMMTTRVLKINIMSRVDNVDSDVNNIELGVEDDDDDDIRLVLTMVTKMIVVLMMTMTPVTLVMIAMTLVSTMPSVDDDNQLCLGC